MVVHLVRSHLHRQRHGRTERLRGLQIDDVLKPRRLLDGKVGWLLAAQDPVEVGGALAELRRRDPVR